MFTFILRKILQNKWMINGLLLGIIIVYCVEAGISKERGSITWLDREK